MNRKSTASEFLLIGMLLIPFIYLAYIWTELPDTIPGHYGPNGKPDRYDPKEQLAFGMAGLTVFLYLTFRYVPRLDPRKNLDTALFQKIRWIIMVFWAAFLIWMWTVSWKGVSPEMLGTSVLVGVGLLVACLGNLMNSVKPNYFVGIRTPWTLESETVWRRTHQLGGRVMLAGGVISTVLALLVPVPYKSGLVVGVTLLSVFIPVVYSYIYFRQEKLVR
ncbi:SdpI family protein [Spirosoma knui]